MQGNISNEKPKRPLSKTLQTRKSRTKLVKRTPVCHWWEVSGQRFISITVKVPWNHKMTQMMSYGSSTPRVFEQSTDRGKHTTTPPPPQTCPAAAFSMPKRWKERIAGCKRKEKHMGHRDTKTMTLTLWKCQKKKKKSFTGICRNQEWITVSKEGWIKEILQHRPSRGH